MRLVFVLLLVLLVSADGASRGFSPVARSLTSSHNEVSKLRATNVKEERAIVGIGEMVKQASKAKLLKVTDSVRVRYWLRKGNTAETIFKRLKLDTGLDKVLTNKNLQTWSTYVKLYNQKHPDKKTTMTELMSITYGDDAVVRMLEVARDSQSTNGLANKLLREMRETWKREKKFPDDVLDVLNLDKAGTNLFTRREFNSWFTYTKSMAILDPHVSAVNILIQKFGADKVARLLATAKPQNAKLKILVMKLETSMLKEWRRQGQTSDKIFKLLKLDDGVDKVFVNPAMQTWMGYLGLLDHTMEGQLTAMVKTFTNSFKIENAARMIEAAKKVKSTSKLATNLQAAQFKLWRSQFMKPDTISKKLNANNEVDAAIARAYSDFYK